MGLSRSTYYDKPSLPADDAAIVAAMIAICDEFEGYGYRRVGAKLRHRGRGTSAPKLSLGPNDTPIPCDATPVLARSATRLLNQLELQLEELEASATEDELAAETGASLSDLVWPVWESGRRMLRACL
jgi:hypothetical protein